MLNPNHQRYVNRLEQLLEEVQQILESRKGGGIETPKVNALKLKTKNIIKIACGQASDYYKELEGLSRNEPIDSDFKLFDVLETVEAVLQGALSDLKGGFLIRQEFIVAGEIFSSVLDQAQYLNEKGFKDPAAVLARVALEDTLRRIARQETIDDSQKASKINDELKKMGRYGEPMRSQIQSWLAIGNSAAHGDFNDFDEKQVKSMIEGIRGFLAQEFQIS